MSDRKRTAERNVAAPLVDGEGMGALLTVTSLNVGPGAPGPEDDWKFPTGPVDETAAEDEVILAPEHGEPPRRPTDKG